MEEEEDAVADNTLDRLLVEYDNTVKNEIRSPKFISENVFKPPRHP